MGYAAALNPRTSLLDPISERFTLKPGETVRIQLHGSDTGNR